MLDAADILIHGQEAVGDRGRGRAVQVPRIGEAGEVPGRVHERVHGVGFPPRGRAALRAGHGPPGRVTVERVAGRVQRHVGGQGHGQVGHRHRHGAARLAMDHGNRAAPVALPRDAPVAQAVLDPRLAPAPVHEGRERLRHRVLAGQHGAGLAEPAHVAHHLLLGRHEGHVAHRRVVVQRQEHVEHRQAVLAREVEVALVVRRAADDGARAVAHQHEIGDEEGQAPGRVGRVGHLEPRVEPELLGPLDGALGRTGPQAFLAEGRDLGVIGRERSGERMVGRDRRKGRPEHRVGPRREHLEVGKAVGRTSEAEAESQPFGAADPVALHQAHLLGPVVQRVERGQKVGRVVGDLQEPLGQLALFHGGARAPAAPVDHLLVGQHGTVDRVPVDLGLAPVDQPGGQEVQEDALLVLVVGGIAGGDLAPPVERQAHALQLAPHRVDVGVGPGRGMGLVLHRGILGRHAERVPAHGMDDVEPLGPAIARHHVAHGVVADVPHVDAPRRVGEHFEHVVFGPRVVVAGAESLALGPHPLPVRLGFAGVVAFVHVGSSGASDPHLRHGFRVRGSEHEWQAGSIRGRRADAKRPAARFTPGRP